jgi:hypothetical protein
MRAALLAVMAIGTLSAIDVAPAQAGDYGYQHGYGYQHDYGYPVCMRTRYDTDDCSYNNFQQCQLTASGLGTSCFANPALAYYAEPEYIDESVVQRPHRRHHPRRIY